MAMIETKTEPMVINMGPHHPSMHGVLRLIVTLDGEDVVDCEPVIGYLHRGMEKIAENRTNVMFVPYVSRWDYAAGMFNEAITVNAPERLADIEVPKRASYIRVIMLELNRIANHLLWLGPFLADVGARIKPGGLLIITSPYNWDEQHTQREHWLGGFKKDGENHPTLEALKQLLGEQFRLLAEPRKLPFVIRETANTFQYSYTEVSIWERRR